MGSAELIAACLAKCRPRAAAAKDVGAATGEAGGDALASRKRRDLAAPSVPQQGVPADDDAGRGLRFEVWAWAGAARRTRRRSRDGRAGGHARPAVDV